MFDPVAGLAHEWRSTSKMRARHSPSTESNLVVRRPSARTLKERHNVATQWPLVGRADEMQVLGSLIGSRGKGGAVLAGPAGVGKTRLARECALLAERRGCVTHWVTATRSAADLPFGASAHLLAPVSGDRHATAEDPADLLRRSVPSLIEHAEGRPLLLVVDDAHLLDDSSATLIFHLATRGVAFVLVTVRTGEPAPDPVVALWKEEIADRIELGGLSPQAVDEVLTTFLGGQVDRAAVAEIAGRSQGNLVFLRELVLGARQDGSLVNDGGVWRLRAGLIPSDRLIELVESRLANLSPAQRGALELLAYGEPLGMAEATALGFVDLLEGLERQSLVTSRRDGRRLEVRLAHPIDGDVLRVRLPAIRARSIAGALADAVEATGARRREDALRIATWRLEGGGGRPELLAAAAASARWRYDYRLAEQLAEAAIAGNAGFETRLLAAQLAALQGRTAEAETKMRALETTDPEEQAKLANSRIDNLLFLGRIEEAHTLAVKTSAAVRDPILKAELAARHSATVLFREGPQAAAELSAQQITGSRGPTLVYASLIAAFSLAKVGRIDDALTAAERGASAHAQTFGPNDWHPCFSIWVRCETLARAGRLREAATLANEQYLQGLTAGSPEARAHFAWHAARAAVERGQVQTATRQAREAATLHGQLGRPVFQRGAQIILVLAEALAGHPDAARRTLDDLDRLDLEPVLWQEADLLVARAWAAVAADDIPTARRFLDEAIGLAESVGDLVGAAEALHGVARLGRPEDAVKRLAELATEIEGPLTLARAAHARALARRDPAGLAAVSFGFEEMDANLLAAEAAANAYALWSDTGQRAETKAMQARADLLISRCECSLLPAVGSLPNRPGLTTLERETALLAARGDTNREIAEKMYISVRTVENRLRRIYQKLAVTNRAELGTLLHEETSLTARR